MTRNVISKKECPHCNQLFSTRAGNYVRHVDSCQNSKKSSFHVEEWLADGKYHCPECDKIYSKIQSIISHYWSKHTDKGKEFRTTFNPLHDYNSVGHTAWNKGLTKETNESVKQYTEVRTEGYKTGRLQIRNFKHSAETKERLSQIARNSTHRRLKKNPIRYKDFTLDSSYELKVAIDLDVNYIKWTRPEPLKYIGNDNKQHHYFPDFYLPEYNVYLDPKNDYLIKTQSEKVKQAASQNNVNVLVLNKNQLTWTIILEMIKG